MRSSRGIFGGLSGRSASRKSWAAVFGVEVGTLVRRRSRQARAILGKTVSMDTWRRWLSVRREEEAWAEGSEGSWSGRPADKVESGRGVNAGRWGRWAGGAWRRKYVAGRIRALKGMTVCFLCPSRTFRRMGSAGWQVLNEGSARQRGIKSRRTLGPSVSKRRCLLSLHAHYHSSSSSSSLLPPVSRTIIETPK